MARREIPAEMIEGPKKRREIPAAEVEGVSVEPVASPAPSAVRDGLSRLNAALESGPKPIDPDLAAGASSFMGPATAGVSDALDAALKGAFSGRGYREVRAENERARADFSRRNPVQSAALQTAGSLLPLGRAKAATAAGGMPARIAHGAGIGATYGALSNMTSADPSVEGTAAGALTGGALGGLASGGRALMQSGNSLSGGFATGLGAGIGGGIGIKTAMDKDTPAGDSLAAGGGAALSLLAAGLQTSAIPGALAARAGNKAREALKPQVEDALAKNLRDARYREQALQERKIGAGNVAARGDLKETAQTQVIAKKVQRRAEQDVERARERAKKASEMLGRAIEDTKINRANEATRGRNRDAAFEARKAGADTRVERAQEDIERLKTRGDAKGQAAEIRRQTREKLTALRHANRVAKMQEGLEQKDKQRLADLSADVEAAVEALDTHGASEKGYRAQEFQRTFNMLTSLDTWLRSKGKQLSPEDQALYDRLGQSLQKNAEQTRDAFNRFQVIDPDSSTSQWSQVKKQEKIDAADAAMEAKDAFARNLEGKDYAAEAQAKIAESKKSYLTPEQVAEIEAQFPMAGEMIPDFASEDAMVAATRRLEDAIKNQGRVKPTEPLLKKPTDQRRLSDRLSASEEASRRLAEAEASLDNMSPVDMAEQRLLRNQISPEVARETLQKYGLQFEGDQYDPRRRYLPEGYSQLPDRTLDDKARELAAATNPDWRAPEVAELDPLLVRSGVETRVARAGRDLEQGSIGGKAADVAMSMRLRSVIPLLGRALLTDRDPAKTAFLADRTRAKMESVGNVSGAVAQSLSPVLLFTWLQNNPWAAEEIARENPEVLGQ